MNGCRATRRWRTRLATVALALLWPALPRAQAQHQAPPGEAISFEQAIAAVPGLPRVRGAQGAADEKRAVDQSVSRVTGNPQLSVQPGFRLRPESARQPELLVELLQPWNLAGYGGARRDTVRLEEALLEAEARATHLAQALGVADAWIAAWAAGRALEDAVRQVELAAELAALVAKAEALGAATKPDRADADAYAAEALLARTDAEGELFVRGVALARSLARRGATTLLATGPLPAAPVPAPTQLAAALAAAERLPAVARAQLAGRAERARAVEERAARGTTAGVGAVLQRDAPDGLVLSAAVRITPPLFDRGERERGTLAASARRLEADAETARAEADAALVEAFHEVEHTQEALTQTRDRLLPAARAAAEGRRRIYALGRATLPEVLMAERVALTAAARSRRAEADVAWARVKLWLLLEPIAAAEARR